MKTLVLGRHAKSDWSQGLPDFDRPLNDRGRRDAPRIGKLLAKADFSADFILSSPANRARTTAEAIASELGYAQKVSLDRRIYDEGHGTLFSIIQDLPSEAETAMVFGHNPTMEQMVEFLMQSQAGVVMPTCALACFEIAANHWKDVHPRRTSLKWLLIPKIVL